MLILCHYGELSLKGENRQRFEKQLVRNIKERFKKVFPDFFDDAKNIYGRIIICFRDEEIMKRETWEKVKTEMKNIFGIANFSQAFATQQDIETMQQDIWSAVKNSNFETFRVTARRSNKNLPFTSQDINIRIGAFIAAQSGKKVSLDKQDLNCFIEIVNKEAFFYFEKEKGAGGMPVGTAGKTLVLLSGGIDSPVAAWHALKRGASADFIHFHSMPYTAAASVEKVKKLAEKLNCYQKSATIYLVPFAEIQKEVMMKTPPKLRVIFYRRLMMKLAETVAKKHDYKALVTGDSLGQVASQTLENIAAVEETVSAGWRIPILRPLIGFDKEEIINIAKRIGTFDISVLPHDDCCTRFIPQHPETRAKIKEVREAEKNLEISKLIAQALEKTDIFAL